VIVRSIFDCIILLLSAQSYTPRISVLRGQVVAWSGSRESGRIQVGEPARSCLFDSHTNFERNRMLVPATALVAGARVEIIADTAGGCRAQTVEIIDGAARLATDSFAPRGDFRFGGLVTRDAAAVITVRTRAGEIHVSRRPDTRYVGDGFEIAPPSLVNKHVFVRAGRDADGGLEAYQVMWGAMVP